MRSLTFILCLLLLAACQSNSAAPPRITIIPFPTVTPGVEVRGVLSTPDRAILEGLANPATVAALAAQPSPTPDLRACPTENPDLQLTAALPRTGEQMRTVLVDFLSEGGTVAALEDTLRNAWDVLGESGEVRDDLDLTGEGAPEIVLSYSAPEGGTLVILGCEAGRFMSRYESLSDALDAPVALLFGDMNRDQRPDVLFTSTACDENADCQLRTQLVTWRADRGRFVSLLNASILSENAPEVTDIDNDQVNEIIIRQANRGTEATGPLRTGVNIYDWNGEVYVLSIVQPDPVRYRVQLIHEADRYFAEQNMTQAQLLYQEALTDAELRDWLDEEEPILRSYIYYRLMLLTAFLDDGGELLPEVYNSILEAFPDPTTAPIYVDLSRVFLEAYQSNSGDLSAACSAMQNVIAAQPAAVDLLNRYGSRSPTYTPRDLCPF
ncbi:MAG: hypothetical protein OHK0046_32560 [Anaerolineae bacterium]